MENLKILRPPSGYHSLYFSFWILCVVASWTYIDKSYSVIIISAGIPIFAIVFFYGLYRASYRIVLNHNNLEERQIFRNTRKLPISQIRGVEKVRYLDLLGIYGFRPTRISGVVLINDQYNQFPRYAMDNELVYSLQQFPLTIVVNQKVKDLDNNFFWRSENINKVRFLALLIGVMLICIVILVST